MADLIDELRRQTRLAHDRLHVHPFMTEVFERRLSTVSYADFLSTFVGPWRALDSALKAPQDPRVRAIADCAFSRTEHLLADLRDLGTQTGKSDEERPKGEMAALGYAYCLIGSSMGAPLLRRRVREQCPEAPLRYLGRSAKAAAWPNFMKLLKSTRFDHSERGRICAGAVACFQQVETSFDRLMAGTLNSQS